MPRAPGRGSVSYPRGRPLGLSAAEAAAGYVLLCQAVPTSDLVVEAREIRRVTDVETKTLPCRVERLERLAPDVMALFLRLPAVEDFRFRAGQYLDVMLPGGRRRSFSIASPPHDAGLIELHVRPRRGWRVHDACVRTAHRGRVLQDRGPLGQFVYREPADAAAADPLVLVAGGTGFAPVKAILRQLLETGVRRPLHLYWGARHEADLYEDAWVRERGARFPGLRYVPVLSMAAPAEAAPPYRSRPRGRARRLRRARDRRGLRRRSAGADRGAEGRAAGPRARPGAAVFDSFEYAPDTLERR